MSRGRRRLLIAGLSVLGGILALLVAGKIVLSSKFASNQVASKLQQLVGGRVTIGSLDVGLGSSTIHDLQFFEEPAAGSAAPAEPWVSIKQVEADATLTSLVAGDGPKSLALRDAAVTLRLDPSGKLATRFPKPKGGPSGTAAIPDVHLDGGALTVKQPGQPDRVFRGITGTFKGDGSKLVIDGGVTDPEWGNWKLDGSYDRDSDVGSGTLRTDLARVTPERLRSIPFVPQSIWDEVTLTAEGPVAVTLSRRPKESNLHYRVTAEPRGARVFVSSIDLRTENTTGGVVVDDGVVTLKGVSGTVAGGELRADGVLDFQHEPSVLSFNLKAPPPQGLDVQQLPAKWQIPARDLGGRMTGWADLKVTLTKSGPRISGQGEGKISLNLPGGTGELDLALLPAAGGGRLEFRTKEKTGRAIPQGGPVAVQVASQGSRPSLLTAAPAGLKCISPAGAAVNSEGREPWSTNPRPTILSSPYLSFALALLLQPPPAGQPAAPPTYVDAALHMKDVDLAELLKRLEVKVPFALAGRLTVELKLSIPVNTPRDIKAYRLNGTASLPRFTVEKLELQDVKARVTLNEGVLKLEELDGALLDNSVPGAGPPPRGTFRGSASYGVEPAGDLNANLTLDRLPLARALQLLPQAAATDTAGAVSGQFTFFAPAGALQDVARYRATARLSSDRLRGYGLQLDGVALALNLDQGVAKLTELRGNLEGTGLSGGGELRLAGNYPYSAELTVTGADLAAINRLAPNVKPPIRLAGKVDVKAEAKGTANPASLALTGSSKATGLKVENFTLGVLDFRFAADTDRLRVTDLKADLYRGAITGEATLPFTATAPGSINLRLRNVDVGAITRDVPQLPVKLEGQVDGTVTASLPPAAPDKPRQPEARIEFLRTRNLKVSDIPADQLTGTVTVQGGVAHFDLKGGLAGGTFGVVGDLPLPGQAPPAAPLPPMREPTVRLQGLQLDQLWPALGLDLLAPLRGELEGTLTLHRGRAGAWEGSGSLTVPSLRWNETLPFNLLSEPLTVTLSFRDSELRGRIRSGAVGGGTVAGRLAYSLAPGGRREFNVALSHVPVERLLVAYPDIASEITGPVDLTVSGSVGPSARGSGSLLAGRAKVYQAELTDLRLPFDWDYDAPSGFGRLAVRDAGAQASLGRATGRMTLMFGGVNRLDGSIQFSDLDLRAFLTQFTTYGSYGAGRITGRFDFGGNDVRSVNDVSGTMTARITQAQALQLPVLRQLVPFLGPAASGATTFNQGDLRANLARGIVRVQRLALSSSAVQLFADGTVTIEQKRLALDIVARTGPLGGPNPSVLQALGMRIPAVGPIPVGLLLEVSQMLSHLTVKVHISGTIANPTVRVNPVPLMSQEAVLFLVGRTPAGLFVP